MTNADQYLATIRSFYPNADHTSEGVDRLLSLLDARLGLAPHQVMSADSICSDDLNLVEYPRRAYEMLGPFKMGGLNGFPFTGLTGMGAFAHHVPADGAVFVFYGPHIGVTRTGVAGEVLRPGQSVPSACCGAARAALARLQANEIEPGKTTDLDYQQGTIEQIFLARRQRICDAANPIVEATQVMYEAIEERIDLLVSRTRYPCRFVVLMGGIVINADHEAGSFVSIRRLCLLDSSTNVRESLLDAVTASG
ncbi:MAG: hypothetical protein ACKV22_24015 [Bryobacteraceae bacterium]